MKYAVPALDSFDIDADAPTPEEWLTYAIECAKTVGALAERLTTSCHQWPADVRLNILNSKAAHEKEVEAAQAFVLAALREPEAR